MKLSVRVPIPVVSEANQSWAEPRYAKGKRIKAQKDAVRVYLRAQLNRLPGGKFPLPATVTLTRVAAKQLDTDNLAGAFKAVRDEIASLLGVDDSPASPVQWTYQQEPAALHRTSSIRIDLEALS